MGNWHPDRSSHGLSIGSVGRSVGTSRVKIRRDNSWSAGHGDSYSLKVGYHLSFIFCHIVQGRFTSALRGTPVDPRLPEPSDRPFGHRASTMCGTDAVPGRLWPLE